MNRRRFLEQGLGLSAPLFFWGANRPSDAWGADDAAPDKMKRIGCTTVCFRPRFPSTRADAAPQPDDWTPLVVPRVFAEQLGVHNVELWSRHFPDTSPAYCRRVRAAAEAVGSRIINIQLDEPGYNLSHADAAERTKSVEMVRQWMDRAAACGATSLRANTGGGRAEPFDVNLTGDCFAQLTEHGRKIGVKILVENHGGHSSDPDNIVAILKHVDSPFCRALPDFGNIPAGFTPQQRKAFLEKLFPYAHLVSAKGMVFDEQYRHLTYDVGASVEQGEAAGFEGIYSVELWAPNYYPPDPNRAVKQMIQTIAASL